VFAVIAGGGTAGHVIPALALAEHLGERGRSTRSIAFVASRRPIDEQLLGATDHPRLLLSVDGFQRSLTPRALARSIIAVPKLVIATARVTRQFRQWRPRVVVSVGGFASEPAVRAARALGIPVVVVSYDQHPGLATRMQAKKAAAVATAFSGSTLPGASHTGAPVRAAIRGVSRHGDDAASERARVAREFDVDPARLIVVAMGGSLGSQTVNDAVENFVLQHASRGDLAVVHLAGERFMQTNFALPANAQVQYARVARHERMHDIWRIADVAVSRAGASTLAELVTVGAPAVVVPWAQAADDHQRRNADWLAQAGAALVVDEADLADGFKRALAQLIDDTALRERVAAKAYALGALNRSSALGALIESAAR
jgi:UDP-N-acetylglucosamine:LPS N-acetylglucosamine transferase